MRRPARIGSLPQPGGQTRGYEIRTGRQRPLYALQAWVSDSTPMGRGRLAPDATPSAAPYASRRLQSSTWSGECVANTGFSGRAARTPSQRDAASRPAGVSRCGCLARSQPMSARAPTNAKPPHCRSVVRPMTVAGTTDAIDSTVKTPPSTASVESPRALTSVTTSARKSCCHRVDSSGGPVVSAAAGMTPSREWRTRCSSTRRSYAASDSPRALRTRT